MRQPAAASCYLMSVMPQPLAYMSNEYIGVLIMTYSNLCHHPDHQQAEKVKFQAGNVSWKPAAMGFLGLQDSKVY